MQLRRESHPRILLMLVLTALLAWPGPASAQEQAAPAAQEEEEKAPEPEPLVASEVAGLARGVETRLEELAAGAEPVPEVTAIREELAELEERLREDARKTKARIEATENLSALGDQLNRWKTESSDLESRIAVVTERAREVTTALDELRKIEEEWKKRLQEAREQALPEVVRTRIRDVLATRSAVSKKLSRVQADLLELQNRMEDSVKLAGGLAGELETAMERSRSAVLGATAPPIWEVAFEVSQAGTVGERIQKSLREQWGLVVDFVSRHRDLVIVWGLAAVSLYAFLVFLRPRARAREAEQDPPEPSLILLERPFSGALVASVLFIPILDLSVPRAVSSLAGLVALPFITILLWRLLSPRTRPVLYGLVGFVSVDRLREALDALPAVERIVYTLEVGTAVLFLSWLMRTGRIAAIPTSRRWRRVIEILQPIVLLFLVLAFFASSLGWVQLGTLLGEAALRSSYTAFAIFVLFQLGGAILLVSMSSHTARRLRVVRSRGEALLYGMRALLQAAGFLFWLDRVLGLFAIRTPVVGSLTTALTTRFEVGALSVSLGGVLSFAIAILVAVYVSRFLQFVLEEEVLPRVRLPRGVPYAISTSARYTVLTLGFLAAVSAAGVDLSSLAFIAGALSVGIGFGLQNVVGNFVSGLILLFERPIQAGDTITVGTVMGEVRRIGIRASVVRDFDGAEVLVPNANLLSEMVVNWTLSDRRRRMEILIGVAYGTDPRRVLALLRETVEGEERLLKDPAPSVQFLEFGESSLDFRVRAWTDDFDNFWDLRSDLIVRINRAIADAGIQIPFPQRDLHVRGVDAGITGSESDES